METKNSYSEFAHIMAIIGTLFLVLFGFTLAVAPVSASTVISDTVNLGGDGYYSLDEVCSYFDSTDVGSYSLSSDITYSWSNAKYGEQYCYVNGVKQYSLVCPEGTEYYSHTYIVRYGGSYPMDEWLNELDSKSLSASLAFPDALVVGQYNSIPRPDINPGFFMFNYGINVFLISSSPSFSLTTTVTQSDSTGKYSIGVSKSDATSGYYWSLLRQKVSSINPSLEYELEAYDFITTPVTSASLSIASGLPSDYNEDGDIGYYEYTLCLGTEMETATKTYTWGSRFGSVEPILEFGSTNIIYGSSTSVEAWYASSSGPVAFVVSEGSSLDQSNMVVLEGSLTDSSVKLISDRFTLTPDRVGCWTFAIIANGKIVKSVTVSCNPREITSGDFDFNYDYIESSKTYRVELTKNSLPLYLTVTGKVFGWMTVYSYSSEPLTVNGQLEEDIVLTDLPAYWTGFGVDYYAEVYSIGAGTSSVTDKWYYYSWSVSDFVGEEGELLNPDKTGTEGDKEDFESLAPPPTIIPGYTTPDLESPSVSVTLPSSDALFDMVENFRLPASLKDALKLVSLEEYRSSLSLDSTHVLYGYQQGIFDLSDNTIGFVFGVLIILISIVAVIPKLLFVTFTDLIVWLSSAFEAFYDWLVIPSEIFNLVIDLIPDEILSLALLLFAVDLIFIFFQFVIPGMISGSHALGDIADHEEVLRLSEEERIEAENRIGDGHGVIFNKGGRGYRGGSVSVHRPSSSLRNRGEHEETSEIRTGRGWRPHRRH